MRKTSLLLALLAGSALTVSAQRLVLDGGDGCRWTFDANELTSPCTFADGHVVIGGQPFALPTRDGAWMTVDADEYADDRLLVDYAAGGQPIVYAPASLAPYLTISMPVDATSDVEITVADALQRELTYVLTGSGNNFILHGNYKSTIVLSGVTLTATDNRPALWVDNGKRIELQLAEGSTNQITDAPSNEKKSALFVKGHAEWKGSGSIAVSGRARHAYSSNEYTHFKPSFTGTFSVLAAMSDGIHVEQYLQVDGGTITVSGNRGDGIDVSYTLASDGVTPSGDAQNGQFIMNGGHIDVTADHDGTKGLKCDDLMTITAGTITAVANGDGSRGVQTGADLILGREGADATAAYITLTASGSEYTDPATGDTDKCRGLKVKRDFHHYPSTLERNAASAIGKKKIVDVDGNYLAKGGKLIGITIE